MRTPNQQAETLRILRKRHVGLPWETSFKDRLRGLLTVGEDGELRAEPLRVTLSGETRGLLVLAEPAGGKTTLVHRVLGKTPALSNGPFGRPAFLEASVPSPATLKSLALALLEKTGYSEVSKRREVWSLWQLLRARMRMLGIAVLWIDEAHDLFCADRGLILRALKALMQGDDAVVVILSGTPLLGQIVGTDLQVQRRFSVMTLPHLTTIEHAASFSEIIKNYCEIAELAPPVEFDLFDRLFHASRYQFGHAIETLIAAIGRALAGGHEQLDMQHFAEAWSRRETSALEANPFLASNWAEIDLDRSAQPGKPSDRAAAPARRTRTGRR